MTDSVNEWVRFAVCMGEKIVGWWDSGIVGRAKETPPIECWLSAVGYFPIMRMANSAAFFAFPIPTVPTGQPGGNCAIE